MEFGKPHIDLKNTSNNSKMEKTFDTTTNASYTTPTSELDELTNCTRCNNKGVNFYLDARNSQKTKLFKAIIIFLATTCAVYVCILSSRRYFYTWVQTAIERTDVHVSEIFFPAITICPVRALSIARRDEQTMTFTSTPLNTDKELEEFQLLLQSLNDITWPSMTDALKTTTRTGGHGNQSKQIEAFLENLSNTGETHAFEAINLNRLLMYTLSYECEDIFGECTWRREKVSCCTLFRKIRTYRGVCYAFNSLQVENPISTWPWIVSNSGLNTGLRVMIKRSSIGKLYEKVATMVHDPEEIDTSDVIYLNGERVVITINPLRFTADYDIHNMSPDIRHCYFTNELRLLGKTRSVCMRNCRMLYIERKCNCTYLFPVAARNTAGNSLPMCKASNLKCLYKHRSVLLSTSNIFEEVTDNLEFNTYNCKCYPNCNYIQYGTMVYTDNAREIRTQDYIDLQVQYQHDTLFSYRSTLFFNILDLMVSYGGIAGLFLGISLVGIIELLHDFIVCWKVKTKRALKTHVKRNDETKEKNYINEECIVQRLSRK